MMNKKSPKATWKDVRAVLAKREPNELLTLIQQLYALSEDNQRFIHARYGLGDLLRPFKEQIEANICPDPMASDEEFSIAKARKAISEYRKAADDPVGTLDLMIYFVECGTRCTLEYGDMWEEYYDSLESMFTKAVKALRKMDAKTIRAFLPRLEKLVRDTEGMGWGYHDGLADAMFEEFPDADVE
jgi:hypothetical protein